MTLSTAVILLIIFLFISANLPWISDRFLLVFPMRDSVKQPWMRLLEWLLLYFICGFTALGLEKKLMGQLHHQDWEFYVIGFFIFMVFAFPGFVYQYELKKQNTKQKGDPDAGMQDGED